MIEVEPLPPPLDMDSNPGIKRTEFYPFNTRPEEDLYMTSSESAVEFLGYFQTIVSAEDIHLSPTFLSGQGRIHGCFAASYDKDSRSFEALRQGSDIPVQDVFDSRMV